MNKSVTLFVVSSLFSVVLFACHNSNDATTNSAGASLTSIAVTPANASLTQGQTLQFTAIGTYSDNSTQDISTSVTWSSSTPGNANISTTGLITAVSAGTTTISAAISSTTGTTNLTVTTAPWSGSITIWPADLPIAVGARQRFFASNNNSNDITDLVSWSVSDPDVATINRDQDGFTYVESVSVGQTTITASYSGKESSTTVSVLPIQTLDVGDFDISYPQIGMDGLGNVTTVWQNWYTNPSILSSVRYDINLGWLKSTIQSNSQNQCTLNMAFNDNGQGLLAWSGPQGSFYTNYSNGWQMSQAFSQSFSSMAIDSSGNGLSTWSSGTVYTSQYSVSTGWSVRKEQGTLGTSADQPALSMNSNGDAVLFWEEWDLANTGSWTLHVAMFDHLSGWQQPSIIYTSSIYLSPTAAIDNQGRVIVVWTDDVNSQVLSTWYIPTMGWQPIQTLKTGIYPGRTKVAVDSLGNALVIWPDNYDEKVYANYYSQSQGWTGAVVLRTATPGYGDTLNHKIMMDAQGNAIAMWWADNIIEVKRFNHLSGWQDKEFLGGLKEAGVYDFNLTMNSSGEAAVAWTEGYSLWDKQYTSYKNVEDLYIAIFSIF